MAKLKIANLSAGNRGAVGRTFSVPQEITNVIRQPQEQEQIIDRVSAQETVNAGENRADGIISQALGSAAVQIGQAVDRKNDLQEMADRTEMNRYVKGLSLATNKYNKGSRKDAAANGYQTTIGDLKVSSNEEVDRLLTTKPTFTTKGVNKELDGRIAEFRQLNDLDGDVGEGVEQYQIDSMMFKTKDNYDNVAKFIGDGTTSATDFTKTLDGAVADLQSARNVALLGTVEADNLTEETVDSLYGAWIGGIVETNDMNSINEARELLESRDDLLDEDKTNLLSDLDKAARGIEKETIVAVKNQIAQEILDGDASDMEDLTVRLEDEFGEFSALTASERLTEQKRVNSAMGKKARQVKQATRENDIVANVLANGTQVLSSVQSAQFKKGLNAMSPERQEEVSMQVAEQGLIPATDYLASLSNNILGGKTPEEELAGLQSIEKLNTLINVNPQIREELDDVATNVLDYTAQGMSLADATKAAEDVRLRTPSTQDKIDAGFKELSRRSAGKPSKLDRIVKNYLDDTFDTTDVTPEVASFVEDMAESLYNRTGTEETIKADLRAATSSLGTNRQGQPELFTPGTYGGGDLEVSKRIEENIDSEVVTFLTGEGFSADTEFTLDPIPATVGTANPQFYIEVGGESVMSNGEPARYSMDPNSFKTKVQDEVNEEFEKQRVARRLEADNNRMEFILVEKFKDGNRDEGFFSGLFGMDNRSFEAEIEDKVRDKTSFSVSRQEARNIVLSEMIGRKPDSTEKLIEPTLGTDQMKVTVPHTTIEQYEGRRTAAYDDSTGKPMTMRQVLDSEKATIGVGHLITQAEKDQGYISIGNDRVELGKELTDAQINKLYSEDVVRFQNMIDTEVDTELTPKQYESILSVYFNVGSMKKIAPKALRALNKGDLEVFATELREVRMADGKVVQGLVDRRNSELAYGWGL